MTTELRGRMLDVIAEMSAETYWLNDEKGCRRREYADPERSAYDDGFTSGVIGALLNLACHEVMRRCETVGLTSESINAQMETLLWSLVEFWEGMRRHELDVALGDVLDQKQDEGGPPAA